jgi:hypothetical protein
MAAFCPAALRFRVVAALRPAARRLRVAAAFFPATRCFLVAVFLLLVAMMPPGVRGPSRPTSQIMQHPALLGHGRRAGVGRSEIKNEEL